MKRLFILLTSLLISTSLSAHTEKNSTTGGGGTLAETSEEIPTESDNKSNESSSEESEETDSESDSSYYSVNKFNFLFYFVYKLNYMDESELYEESKD